MNTNNNNNDNINNNNSNNNNNKNTKKYNSLSLVDKKKLIDDKFKFNYSTRQLASNYGISTGQVSNIINNKEKILKLINEGNISLKVNKTSKYDELNSLVFNFIVNSNKRKIPLTEPIIKKQALYIVKKK